MGEVRLVIDGAAMAALLSAAGPVGQHLITRTTEFQARARAQAPRRTGCLQDSIVKRPIVEEGNTLSITVVSDTTSCSPTHTSYALFVHEGTAAHDIPNAFGWGPKFGIGGRFGGKFHPGNAANRYLTDNLPVFTAA